MKKIFNVIGKRRFLFLFSLILTTQVSLSAYSQEKKITFSLKNATLKEIINEVRKLSDYDFAYRDINLEVFKRRNVVYKDATVDEILTDCLKGTGLVYSITGKTIVIKKQADKAETKKTRTVTGRVTDEKGGALPGVTVVIKGTNWGTATNTNGDYKLEVPVTGESVLQFTFVGMKTQEIKVGDKEKIDVKMEEDSEILDDVVVTGYQMLKEKGMAGAYSKVKAEELVMTGSETIESMLQGKLPGVVVINQSGLTGTRQKVRVRGTSTLVGNAAPVWVVDGIIQEDNLPFKASELAAIGDDNLDMMRDFIGGAVSWLNPNDIEDITVLKDASATSIYGVKAANGVILITTKKGDRGRMMLNYTGNFTTSQKMNYDRQEVMNSQERVDLSREAYERGARVPNETMGYMGLALAYDRREISLEEFETRAKKLELMNTDWFDLLYRTPFSQSHSVSFSGGVEKATYRASFGYRNVKNTAKGNEQVAYTGGLHMNMIFFDKLTLTASLSGSNTETKAFASGVDPFNYAINTSRAIAAYDENGEFSYYDKNGYNYNILNELANSGNKNESRSLSLNVNARWRLTNDLALTGTLGGSTSSSFAETWFTEKSTYIAAIRGYEHGEYGSLDIQFRDSPLPYGGMLTVSESRNFNYTARLQMEYLKVINGLHSVNVMVGLESRSNKYDGYSQTNWGYQPERGKNFVDVPVQLPSGRLNKDYARTKPTVTDEVSNYLSYYATAGYMYDNRYSINLSVRGDGSNRFGEDGKFLLVYSAGLRWNVTDEHWMKNQKLVNNLSFTASLGYQGNVVENVSPNLVTELEEVDAKTGEYRMKWKQLPNPDLKWEKTLSVNLGANFALFGSKLNGSFNWYYKKTTDVITMAKVPYENGTSKMYINDGNMTNRGWDLSFSLVPVRTKDFVWSLGTSFSGNDNEVKSNIEPNGEWKNAVNGSINKKGYPVGSFWAFKYTGLNAENGEPLFDFSRANTAQAAKDATEYMVYMGTREPTFTMGLNMVFRWKRLSFPLNVYFSRGNKEFLTSPYENGYMMISEAKNSSTELNKRWRKPGDEKNTKIPSIPVGNNCRPLYPFEDGKTAIYPLEAWAYSNVRVVDAWYIRFSDLKLSYNLPDQWIKGFAENIAVSFTMTNPLQIKSKDFKGRDPEIAVGQQPRSQDFSLGINMSF